MFFDFPCCSVSFRSFHSMIHHKQPHGMFIVTRAHTLETAERSWGKKKENGASVTASDEVGRGTCQRERCQAPTRSNLVWGRTSCEVKWGNEMTSKFLLVDERALRFKLSSIRIGNRTHGFQGTNPMEPIEEKKVFLGHQPRHSDSSSLRKARRHVSFHFPADTVLEKRRPEMGLTRWGKILTPSKGL